MANGFANRFLLACVERAQHSPVRGRQTCNSDFDEIGKKVNSSIRFAKELGKEVGDEEPRGEVPLSHDAQDLYARFYYQCAQEVPFYPPLIGSMLGRLETIVLRAALTLRCSRASPKSASSICAPRSPWGPTGAARPSTRSVRSWATRRREILLALRGRDDKQMTRTEIYRGLFGNNRRGRRAARGARSSHPAGPGRFDEREDRWPRASLSARSDPATSEAIPT